MMLPCNRPSGPKLPQLGLLLIAVLCFDASKDVKLPFGGMQRASSTPEVLWRSDEPICTAEKDWKKTGRIPNVVFVKGRVRKGNKYFFYYYGGADKYVGIAAANAN